MTTCLRILAVPFDSPALVRDIGPDGDATLYRELFDRDSFSDLPSRVPVQRMHERGEPIGWGVPAIRDDGLEVVAELLDTQRARDSVLEIKSGLMSGSSIGFSISGGSDRWTMPKSAAHLPEVLRRGATLHEVSIVPAGAYQSATVAEVFDRDQRQHELSERELRPVREERLAAEAALRDQRLELARWADEMAAARQAELLAPIPAAPVSRDDGLLIGGQSGSQYWVQGRLDYDQAVWAADAYEIELATVFRMADRAGRAPHPQLLEELERRHGVRTL